MSTALIAAQANDQPQQDHRCSSSMMDSTTSLPPPAPPSSPPRDYREASSAGPDVTPTSPSAPGSLVSLRPLPSPNLYQPSLTAAPKQEPPVVSIPNPSSVSSAATGFSHPTTSSAPALPTSSSLGGDFTSGSSTATGVGTATKLKENTGRWLAEEHEVFLKGLNEHGKQWKKIAVMIKTRSVVQVRTHAQKYFQKLLKSEKKEEGRPGKERTSSISTSTATSTSISTSTTTAVPAAIKRKSSSKGSKTTGAVASPGVVAKKRRVSLEPKPNKASPHQYQPQVLAPPVPVGPSPAPVDHTVIDPSFMNALNMADADGELDESLLDLLDDSSVEAVEQVIGSDDCEYEYDMEPNPVEPSPVSPSASSMSLVDTSAAASIPQPYLQHPGNPNGGDDILVNRQDIVTSPNPTEDFSIHNAIGTSSVSGRELSPTSVACMMDIKDFEQKTNNYSMDHALDWLMDVGVYQLPVSLGEEQEQEEDWGQGHTAAPTSVPAPPLSANKLAQVNSSALSVLDNDVF